MLVAAWSIVWPWSLVSPTSGVVRPKPFPSVPFVVGCAVSHEASDDPIVHPGHTGGSHQHVFFGNTSTNANSTVGSLTVAATTCEDPADRASYWLPGLHGASWTNMRAYYTAGGVEPTRLSTFPLGLQIVAGWKFETPRPPSVDPPVDPPVSWSCGLLADQPGWGVSPPSRCRAGTKLAVRIDFPQCWDGQRLRAPGNMARAVGGSCPRAFPVALPMLRLRVDINGMPTGVASGGFETMHADFWNVWEPKRLEQLVATCIRGERKVQRDVRRCGVPGGGPRAAV